MTESIRTSLPAQTTSITWFNASFEARQEAVSVDYGDEVVVMPSTADSKRCCEQRGCWGRLWGYCELAKRLLHDRSTAVCQVARSTRRRYKRYRCTCELFHTAHNYRKNNVGHDGRLTSHFNTLWTAETPWCHEIKELQQNKLKAARSKRECCCIDDSVEITRSNTPQIPVPASTCCRSPAVNTTDPRQWTAEDVEHWLLYNGLSTFVECLFRLKANVNGRVLLSITEADLACLSTHHAFPKFVQLVKALQLSCPLSSHGYSLSTTNAVSRVKTEGAASGLIDEDDDDDPCCSCSDDNWEHDIVSATAMPYRKLSNTTTPTKSVGKCRSCIAEKKNKMVGQIPVTGSLPTRRLGSSSSSSSTSDDERDCLDSVIAVVGLQQCNNNSDRTTQRRKDYRFDVCRMLLGVVYLVLGLLFSSYMVVVADERTPNQLPPLPDVFLENVKRISWASSASEITIIIFMILFGILVVLHSHRLIILKRCCVILGCLHYFRGITICCTSLPLIGNHLTCAPRNVTMDAKMRLRRFLDVVSSQGLELYGNQMCGDYIYSGHTCMLIVLTHFLIEYTPRRYRPFHWLAWLVCGFGVVCILAAHFHYTVDVALATVIASRFFIYCHILYNSPGLFEPAVRNRRLVSLPLFYLFESRRTCSLGKAEYGLPKCLIRMLTCKLWSSCRPKQQMSLSV